MKSNILLGVTLLMIVANVVIPLVPYEETYVRNSEPVSTTTIDNISVSENLPQVLLDIAWCESRDRQFNSDGSVLRGKINSDDTGRFQINEFWHLKNAISLGIDIYTVEGNTEYAILLYNTNGTKDWSASQDCWTNIEAWKLREQSYY